MKKTRTLLAAAAAIAGLFAFAGPAQAAPPQAQPFTMPLPGTITSVPELPAAGLADGYCSFPVLVEAVTNQHAKDTTGPTGPTATHFAGFGSATVTRLDTGKTLKFNISGPGTLTNNGIPPFTLDLAGPNLLWTTVENSQPAGVPQLAYTTGHVQVSVDENGQTTSYKLNGRSTDVCAALS
jgi:hypothetical protein